MTGVEGVFKPEHVGDALSLVAQNPDAVVMAGGTALMRRFAELPMVIDLGGIPDLQKISRRERYLEIGPVLPISRIISISRQVIPQVLFDALTVTAVPAIRNLATLGGNVCAASPYSTSLPALYVLEATLELRSATTSRWLPVSQFIQDAGKTALRRGELLTRIRIPLGEWNVQVFKRYASPMDPMVTFVSFCGVARISKGTLQDVRFALGSVAKTAIRRRRLESPFVGHKLPIRESELDWLSSELASQMQPEEDAACTQRYRRETGLRLVRWFMEELNYSF